MKLSNSKKGVHIAFIITLLIGMIVLLIIITYNAQSKGYLEGFFNTSEGLINKTKGGSLFFLLSACGQPLKKSIFKLFNAINFKCNGGKVIS